MKEFQAEAVRWRRSNVAPSPGEGEPRLEDRGV